MHEVRRTPLARRVLSGAPRLGVRGEQRNDDLTEQSADVPIAQPGLVKLSDGEVRRR